MYDIRLDNSGCLLHREKNDVFPTPQAEIIPFGESITQARVCWTPRRGKIGLKSEKMFDVPETEENRTEEGGKREGKEQSQDGRMRLNCMSHIVNSNIRGRKKRQSSTVMISGRLEMMGCSRRHLGRETEKYDGLLSDSRQLTMFVGITFPDSYGQFLAERRREDQTSTQE